MRFPSFVTLADRAREVVLRFPWTMAAGGVAAIAAIIGTTHSGSKDEWLRIAAVAALGLALSVALTLFAEARGWTSGWKAGLNAAGVALLVLFYLVWPGPDQKHEAIRYFQLSAGLHLLVATLPFLGLAETNAFWQYNRRLFLGFLRAAVFSFVLYFGLVIALVALDKLFGVDVPPELYARLYLVVVFVINTAIFLAVVPRGLRELAGDTSYPRVLKVFAQYILTPLVFIYLLMLLAYLVKIVAGGEWPSGWIGWLVTSVAVAGLLGFLLVHPLRDDANEAWIRTYTRWLFVGLIPAAVMLLVAFWKRILPYGLTEPRLLGVLLGIWLLLIAISYTIRQDAGIRRIPVTLAVLLLVTLYGPLSVTNLAVASQGRRLARLVAARPAEPSAQGQMDGREVSAALRFLLDHGARREIAAAVPGELPKVEWDSLPGRRDRRDSVASQILAGAGIRYVSEYPYLAGGYVYLHAGKQSALPVSGYVWMLNVSAQDTAFTLAGADSVRVRFDTTSGIARVRVGRDSLAFDVGRLSSTLAETSDVRRYEVPAERLRLEAAIPGRRGALMLESIEGRRTGNTLRVTGWRGTLFLGR
ncbi:MAG: hypothetical protein QOK27_102 [Gemmatimonadales bacterium]|jgi:hypothetical protein|nr:hypothetical protein [Gemmatimonadales bacterium]